MPNHIINKCTWIVLIYFVSLELTITEALQCYTCQNCDDGEDFNELHICGQLPVTTTRRTTPSAATTTPSLSNNSSATTNTTISPDRDDDLDYSDEESEDVVGQSTKTTIRPGNIKTSRRTTRQTTKATRKTTKRPADNEDYSDEIGEGDGDGDGGEDSEYDDEGERRYKQMVLDNRADDPVCYMVKLKEKDNDTIVTHRGCTSMVRSNNIMTCASLSAGLEMHDCQLCNTNGCNKFADFDSEWDALWNGVGGDRSSVKTWFLTSLLIMLLMCIH